MDRKIRSPYAEAVEKLDLSGDSSDFMPPRKTSKRDSK